MKNLLSTAVCAALIFGLPATAIAGDGMESSADDISMFATMVVSEENLEEFQAVLSRVVDVVQTEDGTLIYEYARAGTSVYVYERYDNADAFLRHIENIGPLMPELFAFAQVESVVTMTAIPDSLRPILEQFNATMTMPIASVSH
jgi:quinol monooxygenase YgiN